MRKILVVGAGQSGLQLALGLLAEDYDVTLVNPQGPEEIRTGRVLSTQCLFGPALRRERRHGLDLWGDRAPRITGVGVRVAGQGGGAAPDLDWVGRLDEPARSVDQRLKLAAWLELFVRGGGRVLRRRVAAGELAELGAGHDLVIVAAGRGELSELFPRGEGRSPFREPQRALSLAYVTGAEPPPGGGVLGRTVVPGAGELFTLPTLSLNGVCQALMVEAVPGGPLDRPLGRGATGEDVLAGLLDVLRVHAPWEYERFSRARLADPMAALYGGYTPVVRQPVARLADGTLVLGMADSVVSNDPVTAQGANMASLCADVYRRAVVDHGGRPFDEAFMRAAFAAYWRHARQVTAWSRVMLSGPHHVWELYRLAERHQPTADRFANSFSEPIGLIDWFLHPERAIEYADAVRRTLPTRSSHVPIS
ncbi:styrene monooxygenase/indole monooxygenase family protein [Nocardiopsis metallicus]|uniref:2-polyprenyl-6-methoxyphenol hydroxylase-like FAD-dependent oxidoreductase n=1 Tax=Nocardiopsis metallicus TaxID=179819 RepID=A0A840WI26_9ACTN|nr:styrene monooxygenase/indole monooxygenase family protein [Nocardiopsis metallicus]MBB5491136.1 2-polyprenyl-6-methoxyphenol hydroxylase-like FAD-dependent oxidoreductase [Nocardiopsis metallicus]